MSASGVMLLTEESAAQLVETVSRPAAPIGIGVGLVILGVFLVFFSRKSPSDNPNRRDRLAMSGWAVGVMGLTLIALGIAVA